MAKASLAGAALLGIAALGRYISFEDGGSDPTEYDLGPTSDFPVGSRIIAAEVPALIIHDSLGYKALSLVCPHLGCTVNATGEGFTCPCHGSRFLPDGSLRKGPASKPLANLKMEVNPEGHLVVYTG